MYIKTKFPLRIFRRVFLLTGLCTICLLSTSFTTLDKALAENHDKIVIPVMVGQTGGSAIFGKPELDSYTLAVEEQNSRGGIKGKQVVLHIEDTQTSQKQIVTAFHRIALDKPSVILDLHGWMASRPLFLWQNSKIFF